MTPVSARTFRAMGKNSFGHQRARIETHIASGDQVASAQCQQIRGAGPGTVRGENLIDLAEVTSIRSHPGLRVQDLRRPDLYRAELSHASLGDAELVYEFLNASD